MGYRTTILSYAAVLVALAAWGAVGYFALTIRSDAEAHQTAVAAGVASSNKEASVARLHALERDTEEGRGKLMALLNTDVVGVATTIEHAGTAAGVTAKVSGAQRVGAVSAAGLPIKALSFDVQAQGKFSNLMRVAHSFETLPIPASLERFDMEYAPDPKGGGTWQMSARLKILTTSDSAS